VQHIDLISELKSKKKSESHQSVSSSLACPSWLPFIALVEISDISNWITFFF